jgi:uncharacterized membrane protein YfcA
LLATVFLIGAGGGLLAGLLGVGGAVVLLPLLTAFSGLDLKEASSVTIVQVIVTSLISFAAYQRRRLVHARVAFVMGTGSVVGGFAGGYGTRAIPTRWLEWLFLAVVLLAIGLLFVPVHEPVTLAGQMPPFNRGLTLMLGLLAGGLAGLLGAGGGFLMVPLMIGVMRMPTRLAIGSSPAVILISASSGLLGKLVAGHIRPDLAVALIAGAGPAAYVGTALGGRLTPRGLRLLLALVLVVIATYQLSTMLAT